MDPFGTFGAQQGIPSPPPSPKGDVSRIQAIPDTGMMDRGWDYSPQQTSPALTKTGPNSWTAGRSGSADSAFPAPRSDLTSTIKIYEDMANQPLYYPEASGGGQAIVPPGEGPDDSWRNRIYADRAASQARGGGSYSAGGGAIQDRGRFEPLVSPDTPKFKADEYAPPEQDEGAYAFEREKAMGPGLRALREGTTQAISSSQSLDNPNARSKFIQQALHGYGQGLESVAAQAGREATSITDKQYSRELDLYRTKYDYKRSEDLMNYQSEINKIASDFATQQKAHFANWEAGTGVSSAGGGDARSKSTYYNDQTPNIGYFA